MTTPASFAIDTVADHPTNTWPELAATLAAAILLSTHAVSFLGLFWNLRPSLVLAMGMAMITLWLGPRLLGELLRPAGLVFGVLVAWELVSLVGHILPGAYLAHWTSAELLANAFSYIIIPQFVCFLLGAAIGRDVKAVDRFLDILIWSNLVAVASGILLYLIRPGFFLAAEARVFTVTAEQYGGFLPRMNGYFNSMILGGVCYSGLGVLVGERRHRPGRLVIAALFVIGGLLTMERGAWILVGGLVLLWLILGIWRALSFPSLRGRPGRIAFAAALVMGVAILGWYYAEQQAWFGIAVKEFGNRVLFFNTLVSERSRQWRVAATLVANHPFGVGLGLLSHKAAEIEGLRPYVVTDGQYFEILGATGVLGLFLFVTVATRCVTRAVRAGRWEIALPVLLLFAGAVGTNLFDLYYIGFVFWLLLGTASGLNVPPLLRTVSG